MITVNLYYTGTGGMHRYINGPIPHPGIGGRGTKHMKKEIGFMKKIFILLTAVMVLLSSVSLAEDLSSMPDGELLDLFKRVSEEIERRYISSWQEDPDGIQPAGDLDEDAAERVTAFFRDWFQNRFDDMLALCAPEWKAKTEDPGLALARILADRTPVNMEIITMSGEGDDRFRTVSAIAVIDRNDGREPLHYFFRIAVEKGEDGLWYIDPESLLPQEQPRQQETSVMAMLYYVPEGGQYYHLDPNCKTVNEIFLPMQGSFTYAELEDEPYKDLKPCAVCAAPPQPEKQEPEISFREAVEAAGEFVSTDGDMDYFAVAMEKDGKFIRMVTLTDEHAKELYTAAMEAEDSGEAYEAFQEYTWSLPVTYTEVFTEMPKEQAELDALYGKTVGELLEEGYSFYGISGGSYEPTIVYLSYDPFVYEFETDAPFEQYYDGEDWVGTDGITVKNGMFSGFSGLATDLHYHADGTFVP